MTVTKFIEACRSEMGLAPATLEAYGRDLRDFEEWCRHESVPLLTATQHEVFHYAVFLGRRGKASSTQLRALMSLRAFYDFLINRGRTGSNPVDGSALPKQASKLPDVLSREAVERLLDVGSQTGRQRLRNRAILELFYASGMRVSELITLKLSDWYPTMNLVKVNGKGSKERIIPVHTRAHDVLEEYIGVSRPDLAFANPAALPELFLSETGHRLTRGWVWKFVRDAALRAGLSGVHPHTLRHTFASHLLSGGANLRAIQTMLGHESVMTTVRYTHVDLEHLKDTHKRFHPRP